MPYIPEKSRARYKQAVTSLIFRLPAPPDPDRLGELCYVIYALMVRALPPRARFYDRALVSKAAEHAVHEFVRRHMDGYEDGAIERNGDIF